jgi:hypothetical protein
LKVLPLKEQGFSPDSSMFQLSAFNENLNLSLSIFSEKAAMEGNELACRNYYWSKSEKSPLPKENVKKYESGNVAVVEHDTKKFKGQEINFHSLNAYLANNGYWIDVHISKVLYSKKDHDIFENIVKSVSIRND